jgi:hypothetical protein
VAIDERTRLALERYLVSDLIALRCVAPLLTKVNEPDWPPEATLGIKASCCAMKMGDVLLTLTADHALREKHNGVETLMTEDHVVILHSAEGVRRDLKVHTIARAESETDPDIAAVFLARGSSFDNDTIVPFDNVETVGLLKPHAEPGDVFIALGYPSQLAGIHYSDDDEQPHNVSFQAQRLAGHYVGPSAIGNGMHEVRFADPCQVIDPRGMSGGGIFRVMIGEDDTGPTFETAFAGIITNGSAERMHFVELGEVFARMTAFVRKFSPPPRQLGQPVFGAKKTTDARRKKRHAQRDARRRNRGR